MAGDLVPAAPARIDVFEVRDFLGREGVEPTALYVGADGRVVTNDEIVSGALGIEQQVGAGVIGLEKHLLDLDAVQLFEFLNQRGIHVVRPIEEHEFALTGIGADRGCGCEKTSAATSTQHTDESFRPPPVTSKMYCKKGASDQQRVRTKRTGQSPGVGTPDLPLSYWGKAAGRRTWQSAEKVPSPPERGRGPG
ncbi:MAG: hypothetical protein MZV65_42545 [Chromatiales bacterium]|nr:hypothetical protein [Chromatiales bacterium]